MSAPETKPVDAALFGALLFPFLPLVYFIALANHLLPRPFGVPSLANLIEVFVVGAFGIAACLVVHLCRRQGHLLSLRSLALFVLACYLMAIVFQIIMPSIPE